MTHREMNRTLISLGGMFLVALGTMGALGGFMYRDHANHVHAGALTIRAWERQKESDREYWAQHMKHAEKRLDQIYQQRAKP